MTGFPKARCLGLCRPWTLTVTLTLGEVIKIQIGEPEPLKAKPRAATLSSEHSKSTALLGKPNLSESAFANLKEELEAMWRLKHIPEPQRVVYRSCIFGLSRSKAAPVIIKEIEELRHGTSTVQIALSAIAAREESLHSLHEMNEHLMEAPAWEKLKDIKVECAEMLHAHRMLSLTAVESIVRWRDSLSAAMMTVPNKSKPLPFVWQGENYLIKMRTDMDFLAFSDYSKVFQFADMRDPLLVTPSQNHMKRSPAKSQKGYFTNGTEVFIPLPSILMPRVKTAEKVIFGEDLNWEFLVPGLVEPASPRTGALQTIIEEAIEEAVPGIVAEALEQEKDRAHATVLKNIVEEWTREEVSKQCQEIVQEVAGGAKQTQNDQVSGGLAEKLLELTIKKELTALVKETVGQAKLNKKLDPKVAPLIRQDCIEAVIADLLPDIMLGVIQEEKERLDENERLRRIEREKLNDQAVGPIAEELLREFIDSEVFLDLAYEAIQEEEPSRIESADVSRVELQRHLTLHMLDPDFEIESDFSDLRDVLFVPMGVKEALISTVLEEYYDLLPPVFRDVLAPVPTLLRESLNGNNPCFFWAKKFHKVLGVLIYTEYCHLEEANAIAVHHFSCLQIEGYHGLLGKAEEFIRQKEHCETLRLEFLSQDYSDDIPRSIKQVLSQYKYRWKANPGKSAMNTLIYGKDFAEQTWPPSTDVSIRASSYINCSPDEVDSSDSVDKLMITVGNRHCLLKCLLGVFGDIAKNSISLPFDTASRLQADVTDVLGLINATDSFAFPYMNVTCTDDAGQIATVAAPFTKGLARIEGVHSISELRLDFRWTACTHVLHTPLDKTYKFLRFRSENIHYKVCDIAEIYLVPTMNPVLKAFFIVSPGIVRELAADLRNFKTDLYYKVEGLLRSSELEVQKTLRELWVPGFNLKAEWVLPWLVGYNVPPQTLEGRDLYVKFCAEKLEVTFNTKDPKEGLLPIDSPAGDFISQPFIFGIIEDTTHNILESPVFATLIQEKDWVRA